MVDNMNNVLITDDVHTNKGYYVRYKDVTDGTLTFDYWVKADGEQPTEGTADISAYIIDNWPPIQTLVAAELP